MKAREDRGRVNSRPRLIPCRNSRVAGSWLGTGRISGGLCRCPSARAPSTASPCFSRALRALPGRSAWSRPCSRSSPRTIRRRTTPRPPPNSTRWPPRWRPSTANRAGPMAGASARAQRDDQRRYVARVRVGSERSARPLQSIERWRPEPPPPTSNLFTRAARVRRDEFRMTLGFGIRAGGAEQPSDHQERRPCRSGSGDRGSALVNRAGSFGNNSSPYPDSIFRCEIFNVRSKPLDSLFAASAAVITMARLSLTKVGGLGQSKEIAPLRSGRAGRASPRPRRPS